jgi:hypothetical protein
MMDFQPLFSLADSIKSIKEWTDAGGLTEQAGRDESFAAGLASSASQGVEA